MSFDLGTIFGSIDFDTAAFEQKYARVDQLLDQIAARQVPAVKVDADTNPAESAVETFVGGVLEGMKDASVDLDVDTEKAEQAIDLVEGVLVGMQRREYDPQVDVDITKAEKKVDDIRRELQVLDRMEPTTEVKADVAKAEKSLASAESRLKALQGLRAEMEVTADTSAADGALDDVADKADAAGDDAGSRMGDGMVAGILAGLASIPIAGAVVKVGQAIAGGLLEGVKDGLGQEVTRDLFSARTGLDEATAARFARAAGNAYADAFGESVEANLDNATTALQSGLIDADATTVEIQTILAQLDVAGTVIQEDANRIATAVGVMLKTGIADNAEQAFDILVRGQQLGINAAEDLIDTFVEYPALFERLGLSAEEALGLLNQGMEGGARNADLVADALKEFQIRATDASEASAEGFEAIGLNAEKMTDKIAKGGKGAREGLGQVLEGLKDIEDPVERNLAGVALFGTQWEDLGNAILNLDLSNAVSQLGGFEGALNDAMTALGQNPATEIESAQRQIELAADGIKGALASAFGEPLTEFADWVQGNRAGVMEFLGGVTNGMFDLGRAGVEGAAAMIESFGDFISGTGPAMVETIIGLIDVMGLIPGIDIDEDEVIDKLRGMQQGMHEFGIESHLAADELRTNLIDNGIAPAQDAFNSFLDDEVVSARVHDLTTAMVEDLESVGTSLDDLNGINLDTLTGRIDTGTEKGALFDEQLRTAVDSMYAAQDAAAAAGESQGALNDRWAASYGLLVTQLQQMGLTEEQAYDLVRAYGAIPDYVSTMVNLDTSGASIAWDSWYRTYNGRTLTVYQQISRGYDAAVATGGDVDRLADLAAGRGRAGGGSVIGAGTGTSDSIPAGHPSGVQFWLSNGEHVLSADDVLDLGGQQGAYALRAMIQAGLVKPLEHDTGTALAGGGGVGVSTPVPVAASGPGADAIGEAVGRQLAGLRLTARLEGRDLLVSFEDARRRYGSRMVEVD